MLFSGRGQASSGQQDVGHKGVVTRRDGFSLRSSNHYSRWKLCSASKGTAVSYRLAAFITINQHVLFDKVSLKNMLSIYQ